MITMLLGGLWHGSSWNFIIWGALNGFALVFYKLWKKVSPWENYKHHWYVRAWAVFLTFSFITLTRVWFRAGSNSSLPSQDGGHDIGSEFWAATSMLEQIFLHMDWSVAPQVLMGYASVFVVIVFGLVVHWLPSNWKENYRSRFSNLPIPVLSAICIGVVFFAYQIMSADMHPFIYFQF